MQLFPHITYKFIFKKVVEFLKQCQSMSYFIYKHLTTLGAFICSNIKSKLTTRNFHVANVLYHGEYEWQDAKSEDEIVNIKYILKDGKHLSVKGKVGDNIMYLAHRYEIPIEGACEASLACTTCHVYVNENYIDKLPEATEREEDLLDMAPFLKENSRLGCQIILTKEMEGIVFELPKATRNFYVDGHVPKPH